MEWSFLCQIFSYHHWMGGDVLFLGRALGNECSLEGCVFLCGFEYLIIKSEKLRVYRCLADVVCVVKTKELESVKHLLCHCVVSVSGFGVVVSTVFEILLANHHCIWGTSRTTANGKGRNMLGLKHICALCDTCGWQK